MKIKFAKNNSSSIKTKLLAIIFFGGMFSALSFSCASAATYYVDINGNNGNSGSQGSPFASLSHACFIATSNGDIIHINASTNYIDNSRCSLSIGVKIEGAGKDLVKITSSYNGTGNTGYIFRETTPPGTIGSPSPLVHGNNDISGFTLDGNNKTLKTGIWLRGTDNIVIHDMKFQHIFTRAIMLAGWSVWPDYDTAAITPPPAWAYGDIIHDVYIDDCSSQTSDNYDDRYGAIDLEALSGAQVYNININENYPAHGTGIKSAPGWLKGLNGYNWNIHTYDGYSDDFVIEMYNFTGDSEIYNSQFYNAISLNSGPKTLEEGSSWNLKIHDTYTDFSGMTVEDVGHELSHNYLDFYNNYVTGNKGRCIGLWKTNYLTKPNVDYWRFRNNVLYDCADGISIGDGIFSNIEIYNNIFDNMTQDPWGGYAIDSYGMPGTMTGAKIKNNLIMNAVSGPIYLAGGMQGTIVDHNWFYANGNNNNITNGGSGTVDTNNTRGIAPQIKNLGDRPSPFYEALNSGSNIVNAGTNVGLSYVGSNPDIGAFEYGASNQSAPSSPTGLLVY